MFLDVVAFKKDVSQKWGLNGPWILLGCSYAGALVTWLKKMYPDEFAGAIASSAPIVAKVLWISIQIKQDPSDIICVIFLKIGIFNNYDVYIFRPTIISIMMKCLKFWKFVIAAAPRLWSRVLKTLWKRPKILTDGRSLMVSSTFQRNIIQNVSI